MIGTNSLANRRFISLNADERSIKPSQLLWTEIRRRGHPYLETAVDLSTLRLLFELNDQSGIPVDLTADRKRFGVCRILEGTGIKLPKKGSYRLGVTWTSSTSFYASLLPLFPSLISWPKTMPTLRLKDLLSPKEPNKNTVLNKVSQLLLLESSGYIRLGNETLSRLYQLLQRLVIGKVASVEDTIFLESLDPSIDEGFTTVEALFVNR
jgi:hypothetical protein